jgi:hypothetical protein
MATIEERLSALESELAEVKRQLKALQPDWLKRVVGSMDEWPEFEEVLRLGREFRDSVRDLPEDDEEGTPVR